MNSEILVYKLGREEIEKRYGKVNKDKKKSSGFKEPYWTINKQGENVVLNVTKIIEHLNQNFDEEKIYAEYPETPYMIIKMLYERALKYM